MHERGELEAAIEKLREARPRVRERGRASGCGPRASATTRTECSSAPTASPPTSPPDIAYHHDKLERGAERLIDVLGADHHGYVPRMRAAIEALGDDPDNFEAPIIQIVHLVRGRRAGPDVEAEGRVRAARRADRRHRRRRGPLLHAPAQPRDGARPRPRAGASPVAGQPRLLRPVRARPDREHPAQGGRRGQRAGRRTDDGADEAAVRRGGRAEARSRRPPSRPSGRSSSGCWSFPPRRRGRPSAALRTAWPPTRRRPPPTSTPSIATARWSGRPTASSRRAWRSAWRRSG